MDEQIIEILTQALGDPNLARMTNALHRLAVTVQGQSEELTTLKSAIERMAPPGPPDPPTFDMEI